MRRLWSLGVLVCFGVLLFRWGAGWRSASPPSMFLAELLLCGLPGLLASTSLTCQVSVAHLTSRLCFPSDNQILCVVWWLLQSFTAPSAVIYTFLSIFYFAADWLVAALRYHPSPQTRQPRDINHKLTFLWLILSFRIPVTSVRSPKAMSVASVFQISNRAEIWSVCRFDIIKRRCRDIKRPLKPCLPGATCHPQSSQQ